MERGEARYYAITTGVFKTFSSLEVSQDAILEFATEYGHLGIDVHVGTLSHGFRDELLHGEYFNYWRREIECMRHVVDAWEMTKNDPTGQLAKHVVRNERGRPLYDPLPDVSPRRRPPWSLPCLIPDSTEVSRDLGEVVLGFSDKQVALLYVQSQLNAKLNKHSRAGLIADSEYSRLHIRFVPTNLIGALWLQLGLAISGNAQLRKCSACPKWFEVSTNGRRSQTESCSDSCKMRRHRKRIQEASRLTSEGKSVRQIASMLNARPDSVSRWIGRGRVAEDRSSAIPRTHKELK